MKNKDKSYRKELILEIIELEKEMEKYFGSCMLEEYSEELLENKLNCLKEEIKFRIYRRNIL